MSKETILPDLQACVLCEDVRAEVSGQNTLVGVIAAIPAPMLPIGFFKLCLWTRWVGGHGQFRQRSVIVGCDDDHPITQAEIRFELKDMESQATNVHFFGGVQFQKYGLYHVEVYLEDELRLRFPLPVVQVKQSVS